MKQLNTILHELGIDPNLPAARGLPLCESAQTLVFCGLGSDGRDKFLIPEAARAWRAMCAAAATEGVALRLISAFRSIEFQAALIRARVNQGMSLIDALKINAPPGYSEHHTGRAVDIGTPGCAALDEAFEHTPAFAWLSARAAAFGFALSYPRNNPQGFLYEPWHWCFARASQ
ncbi:M15 family metallopeptidase [Sinimarinibacterium sp. NLF-5-8]|uniref:M15 family metallopeptidase n=1 Tax=Sinimarinibacterium sp. NLF-5-8 TaxID=2698684 RepID=UPI00137B95B7|nr:M15 family metallopeptidase [Sinimarinibacterium sp. NLF-5-8]QHS10421.1 M15 family metallopeptidase [Sinimarinibacterium sp. NLF-5-8]